MSIHLKKRGRPSKADIAARTNTPKIKFRSDEEVLTDLVERFKILSILTEGTVAKNVRALVVTGGPGVGKTYTVENILEHSGAQYEIVRGAMSAVNLYKLAYRNRKAGNVVVIDDADSIFNDEEALNILKAICDTSATRRVSWLKESNALVEDDIPQQFDFNGAVIFISNLNFQQFVDDGKNKYAQHFEALMSRALYMDLRIHSRTELGVWVEHVTKVGKIFERENISENTGNLILHFIRSNRDTLRELSIRTLLKTCQLAKTHPTHWDRMAKILLTKGY